MSILKSLLITAGALAFIGYQPSVSVTTSTASIAVDGETSVSVTVTNTGDLAGAE